MTVRHISLLSLILAVIPAAASQHPFVNTGAIVNQGNITHFGPFYNSGLVVNAPGAHFQTGNIPHYPQYQQAQYPRPHHGQQPKQAQYQPQLNSFYGDPRIVKNLRQQNPQTKNSRSLTPEEQKDVAELQRFREVSEFLPKNFQNSVKDTDKISLLEQSLVARSVLPRMKQDANVQDLEKVMHVFTGTNKEQNLLPAPSSQKVNIDHPLFFFNKEEKSLFCETPNTPFEVPKSPRKLFYTPSTKTIASTVPSVCNQLKFNEGKAPIHAAAFNKWDISR